MQDSKIVSRINYYSQNRWDNQKNKNNEWTLQFFSFFLLQIGPYPYIWTSIIWTFLERKGELNERKAWIIYRQNKWNMSSGSIQSNFYAIYFGEYIFPCTKYSRTYQLVSLKNTQENIWINIILFTLTKILQ